MSRVGIPEDQFCWDNAKILEGSSSSNPRWRCNHCGEEYQGSAQRIRNHLAGEGGEIIPCPKVDPQIRELARKERADLLNRRGMGQLAEALDEDEEEVFVDTHSSQVCTSTDEDEEEEEVFVDTLSSQVCTSTDEDEEERVKKEEGKEIVIDTHRDEYEDEKEMVKNEKGEEMVLDRFVEFMVHGNVSVKTIMDPHLRGLLKMIAQHREVPSWLNQDNPNIIERLLNKDNLNIIQRLLWDFSSSINAYIWELKESWKRTGCTNIFYNLEVDGKIKSVIGWYSSKGFFFTEQTGSGFYRDEYRKSIYHRAFMCHYQVADVSIPWHSSPIWCVQERIEGLWFATSHMKWVGYLIEKSSKIFTYMKLLSPSSEYWIQEEINKTVQRLSIVNVSKSSLATVLAIMNLKGELKRWLSDVTEDGRTTLECDDGDTEIISIINSDEFWCEGGKLRDILESLIRIYDLVDTLAPIAGYLHIKIDEEKEKMEIACDPVVSKYRGFWECFEKYLGDLTREDESAFSFLSPAYISTKAQGNLFLSAEGKRALKRIVDEAEQRAQRALAEKDALKRIFDTKNHALELLLGAYSNKSTNPLANIPSSAAGKDDLKRFVATDKKKRFVATHKKKRFVATYQQQALEVELEAYSNRSTNPLANIPSSESSNHPIELWEKYGGDQFPLLKKCAINLMSQPVSCMCNQVKKRVSEIQGSEKFIERLNWKMMREFKNMGSRIYTDPLLNG